MHDMSYHFSFKFAKMVLMARTVDWHATAIQTILYIQTDVIFSLDNVDANLVGKE